MPSKTPMRSSAAVEDYLERILDLINTKGYARVVDIASSLGISQASVTNMVQRLDAEGRDETRHLAPLDRAVASGLAPADELLAQWQGAWKGSFVPLFRDHAY